ncbi:MAG: hypothetical protein ACKO96_46285, partial [Flammeovirgaceae bacterium]
MKSLMLQTTQVQLSSKPLELSTQDLWSDHLIKRHDLAGPRYTSYPTAPQFSADFSYNDWRAAVDRSNASGADLSLYVHIPFCDTICFYCGCNKIITADKKKSIPYLSALNEEIKTV